MYIGELVCVSREVDKPVGLKILSRRSSQVQILSYALVISGIGLILKAFNEHYAYGISSVLLGTWQILITIFA